MTRDDPGQVSRDKWAEQACHPARDNRPVPTTATRADRLRELRKKLKWSQSTVAARAGLSADRRDWIAKMESGANQISGEDAQDALARAFGTTSRALLDVLDGKTPIDTFVRQVSETVGPPPKAGLTAALPPAPPVPTAVADPSEIRYQYLPAALLYATRKGKTYDDEVIAAAKALVFRGEEPDPERWEQLLDSQKRTLGELRSGRAIGVPVQESDVAKPSFKRKR